MVKHCPTCDRSSDDISFIGEFCEECVTNKLKTGMPDSATIDRCKSCERIRTNFGYEIPDKLSIKDAIGHSLGVKYNVSVKDFDWKSATVRFNLEYQGESVSFEMPIKINVKKTMCIDCYRKTSGYFEAILQLRGPRDLVDKMMARFMKFIGERGAFSSRVDELDNGYDIYMSSKKIAAAFFMHYELKPKRSFTLYGMKNGNKLYRNTYMLRLGAGAKR
jgi:NMD protein affecting ribosome stability and mRNA decay